MYLGLGAYAIAAGTVSIPGLVYDLTISEALFNGLTAFQTVQQAKFNVKVRENEITRDVAAAYNRLLGAAGRSAVRRQILDQAEEVKRLTAVYAKVGKGRQSDAERAASDYRLMHAIYLESEGDVLLASARMAELLTLPPDVRLCPVEKRLLPVSLVPPPICLRELLAIGLLNRPELGREQATIRAAMLKLTAAKVLPFSPQIIVGLSYGSEGGGSNLIHEPDGSEPFARSEPRFDRWNDRLDFDAVWFWSIQNFGIRNLGLCREASANLQMKQFDMIAAMDMVREQVTSAYTQSQARFARIISSEKAIETIRQSFEADLKQIKGGEGLPIELLDSLRLLARAQEEYVDAIIEYNQAQIELYFALGQPPADYLARPAPDVVVTPAMPAIPAAQMGTN
jgi:outer membrane protein TolC